MYSSLKTEYSFKKVFAKIPDLVKLLASRKVKAACIADIDNTFGHYEWSKHCKEAGIKPVFGVNLGVVKDPGDRSKQPMNRMTFIAYNNQGLHQIYMLIKKAYDEDHFYYVPRIGYQDIEFLDNNVAIISGARPNWDLLKTHDNILGMVTPTFSADRPDNTPGCAVLDNHFLTRGDKDVYQLFTGELGTTNDHLLTEDEFLLLNSAADAAIKNSEALMDNCHATLGKAPMVKYSFSTFHHEDNYLATALGIREICHHIFNCSDFVGSVEYTERLVRELDVIEEKDFGDYFLIVSDLVNWAKQQGIFVGPARGSSAGSLVCYLLGITDVDPLEHDLLFERFIDITRADLPDIDIDFPDTERERVIQYLIDKYGEDKVAKVGTVSTMRGKSAIGEFAKALNIPPWDTKEIKDALIERLEGDERYNMCLEDTYKTEVGTKFLADYPSMALSTEVEGHARHSGIHAAGVVVCPNPLHLYCGINSRDNVAMVDKGTAEYSAGLLKIDVLGLRTLSVLQECLVLIGEDHDFLNRLPLDDEGTIKLFQDNKTSGVFQFEGYTISSLTQKFTIETFDDLVAITSLARPGPLSTGGPDIFIKRRTGKEAVTHHPLCEDITAETFGVIVYQEQVMKIVREVGQLTWEETTAVRKAMGKSQGEQALQIYRLRFLDGARKNGLTDVQALAIWNDLLTFGAYGFNKSHAVSYALISYWAAYLKAHHTLEFTVASMNHLKDEKQGVRILRDYVDLGFKYIDVDPMKSGLKWVVDGDQILGPLSTVKGIGTKMAEDIVQRRDQGDELKPGQAKKLNAPVTLFTDLYPTRTRYGSWYTDPASHEIRNHQVDHIINIQDQGDYCFIGRLTEKEVCDANDHDRMMKRGGRKAHGQPLFLKIKVEDDTDEINCMIGRDKFLKLGNEISETGLVNQDYYLILGKVQGDWRNVQVANIRRITA